MKHIPGLAAILFLATTVFASCGETKEADDHANWKSRNAEYIDNVAYEFTHGINVTTPENATEGQLFRILSYKLDPGKQWDNGSYIYCEVITKGAGLESPLYTDSIRMNYRVRLIPTDYYPEGQVIDQSFKTTDLDPSVNIPYSFRVSSLIDGVTTAVMHMHTGDFWRVYIPYGLGYGTNDKGTIPGYSALIYEINLTEIAPTGHDLSPR